MVISLIIQEFVNLIPLLIALIVLYQFIPRHFFKYGTMITISLGVGIFVSLLTYYMAQRQLPLLKFSPSELWRKSFENEVSQCGLQPKDINLRYNYADDSVAISIFNTIAIDPMIWKGLENDQQAVEAKNSIEKFIIPKLPASKRVFQDKIKNIISPDVQKFIFKHELGHIFHNYSLKRTVLVGAMGAVSTLIALVSASAAIPIFGGVIAIVVGLLAGGTSDFLSTYSSNIFFKAQEERRADDFAVQFSSKKEIEAAADFFEKYELYAQEYRKELGWNSNIPSIILTGYTNGKTRAKELLSKVSM